MDESPIGVHRRCRPRSWPPACKAVTSVPYGVAVVAAGPPRVVEGYLMVPIVPSGAVELTLFRELTADGEAEVPTEEELRAALLNFGKEPLGGGGTLVPLPERTS